jgi:predicted GNAT superfamily acetyltransferase
MRTAVAPPPALVDDAASSAAKAAARAGVEIVLLEEVGDFRRGATLLADIWGSESESALVSKDVLRALAHSGNYVAGAFLDGRLVGLSVGFLGQRSGHPHLHSHISGIAADAQQRHIGFALKQHQRMWTLQQGVDRVIWTFDPLVRRNAYFNLAKLGATITEFHQNFYGDMTDGINAGDESDRVVVEWALLSRGAVAAASDDEGHGHGTEPVGDVVLHERSDGRPEVAQTDVMTSDSARLAAWVPPDAIDLRRRDPQLALEWRRALRRTVGRAIQAGYTATNMTRTGWYELERGEVR